MARRKLYHLPDGKYEPAFLKALACAIQCDRLEPNELEEWFKENQSQYEMAKTMYDRIK